MQIYIMNQVHLGGVRDGTILVKLYDPALYALKNYLYDPFSDSLPIGEGKSVNLTVNVTRLLRFDVLTTKDIRCTTMCLDVKRQTSSQIGVVVKLDTDGTALSLTLPRH